jgi:hypothetical protein
MSHGVGHRFTGCVGDRQNEQVGAVPHEERSSSEVTLGPRHCVDRLKPPPRPVQFSDAVDMRQDSNLYGHAQTTWRKFGRADRRQDAKHTLGDRGHASKASRPTPPDENRGFKAPPARVEGCTLLRRWRAAQRVFTARQCVTPWSDATPRWCPRLAPSARRFRRNGDRLGGLRGTL